GQTSSLKLIPSKHAAVALLTNSAVGSRYGRDLFRTVLRTWFDTELPSALTEPGAAGLDVAPYLGTYAQLGVSWQLARRNGSLVARYRLSGESARMATTTRLDLPVEVVDATSFLVKLPGMPTATAVGFSDFAGGGPRYLHLGLR